MNPLTWSQKKKITGAIKWKACEPSYHNLNQPGMIDYVMLLSRLISWGGLLFSAGFWIACENEGEMILGFMGTVAFLTLTIRLHPQPFYRFLRWIGLRDDKFDK